MPEDRQVYLALFIHIASELVVIQKSGSKTEWYLDQRTGYNINYSWK